MISYFMDAMSMTYGNFGIAGTLVIASMNWILGLILHHVVFLMLFPLILSRYYIDLYELDPGSSPSIRDLSLVIRNSSYQISIYYTLFILSQIYVVRVSTPLLSTIFLLPIIGIFVFRQIALTRIVARSRNMVLDRLRQRIEALDIEQHIENPSVYQQFKALTDYYNQIKNADTGVFDLRTGLLLFNSLLLPTTAFILTQFDRIVTFFNKFVH
jgi:hypothetical protein